MKTIAGLVDLERMKVTQETGAPEMEGALVLRASSFACALWFALAVGLSVGAVYFLATKVDDVSGLQLAFMSPFVVIGGLILLLGVMLTRQAWQASRRDTNWSFCLWGSEIQVNLRDYRNAAQGEEYPVLHMDVEELESARIVRESFWSGTGSNKTNRKRQYIEVSVPNADTKELARVLLEERQHPGLVHENGGTTKVHHACALVLEDHAIRFPWQKQLEKALRALIPFSEGVESDLIKEFEGLDAKEKAQAFAVRGYRSDAIRVLITEEKMSRDSAKEWIKDSKNAA